MILNLFRVKEVHLKKITTKVKVQLHISHVPTLLARINQCTTRSAWIKAYATHDSIVLEADGSGNSTGRWDRHILKSKIKYLN